MVKRIEYATTIMEDMGFNKLDITMTPVEFESKVLVLVGEHSATIYINGVQVYYAHGDMVDIVDTRVKIDYEDPMRTMQ